MHSDKVPISRRYMRDLLDLLDQALQLIETGLVTENRDRGYTLINDGLDRARRVRGVLSDINVGEITLPPVQAGEGEGFITVQGGKLTVVSFNEL